MENKTYSRAQADVAVDAGLRSYMIKVYNFMAAGLCLTALSAYIVANTSLLGLFFNLNRLGQITGMSGFGWLMLIAPLIMVFAFQWVVSKGSQAQAQALFWSYAAVMGVSLTPIILLYTGASLARVFLITAGTFGAMSLYGYTTKRDLTAMGSFLIMGLWGIIIASIINIFMGSSGLEFAISFLAVGIFVGLTAYDTQRIRSMYMSADSEDILTRKALVGALGLYLDFINLFIYLMRFLGDRR